MLGILAMILVFGILVLCHELGHLLVARLLGFRTPIFGLGLPFGPYLTLGKIWDTEIRIHLFVFGGYVAIPELHPQATPAQSSPPEQQTAYHRVFPVWQRLLVIWSGPVTYVFLAWLIMFGTVITLGAPAQTVMVANLPPTNRIAADAGIQKGDEIVRIDNQNIESTDDLISYLGSRPSTRVVVHVMRDSQPVEVPMMTNEQGKVGMSLDTVGPMKFHRLDQNVFQCAGYAASKLARMTERMVTGMSSMLFDQGPSQTAPQSNARNTEHRGSLAVLAVGAAIATQDWRQLPMFAAMLSMDFAIFNLIPWLGFDGGHAISVIAGALRNKPTAQRAELRNHRIGVVALIATFLLSGCPLCSLRSPWKDRYKF
jgi:regulator of sigma E protease